MSKTTTTKAKHSKREKAADAQTRTAAVDAVIARDAAANAPAVDPDRIPLTEALMKPKAAKGAKAKMPKAPKPAKADKPKKVSGLDAAFKVLSEAGEPMRCKDVVDKMLSSGLWQTGGKTPAATIYAAILREIQTKGSDARFKKTDRGLFTANAQ